MSRKKKEVEVVPNGVDIDKFKVQSSKFKVNKKDKRILFIGDFRWVENKDAVGWILREIWPKIHDSTLRLRPAPSGAGLRSGQEFMIKDSIKLWIVGRHIPNSIKKLTTDKDVIFDENAQDDTTLIYQKADILLAPIRVGGGTSFKILEAMASGVPVVTTVLGNAISAEENLEILVANSASELAGKIISILNDSKLYKKIAANARKFIEEKYGWEEIVEKLEDVYEIAKLQA